MQRIQEEALYTYCEKYSTPEASWLVQASQNTFEKTRQPYMLSGHLQGRVLSLISTLIKPTNILEIGTFTGYSAMCLAEGLDPQGRLITIDNSKENIALSEAHIAASPYAKQIQILFGDAKDILPTLSQKFDLVFIDADKQGYSKYLDLVIEKMNVGACLLADNVLFKGEVLNLEQAGKFAKALHAYNEKINQDPRLENVLLPIRDGIMISRKKY
ncbi:MAG: O-methyltransferase [Chitinophagaceae bacterium]